MSHDGYLQEKHPRSFAYAQKHGFSTTQFRALTNVMKIVDEFGFSISMKEIATDRKIDNGAFGHVYKGSYKGEPVVLKRINQVPKDENAPPHALRHRLLLTSFRSRVLAIIKPFEIL